MVIPFGGSQASDYRETDGQIEHSTYSFKKDKSTPGSAALITQHNTLLTRDKYKDNMWQFVLTAMAQALTPASEDDV